MIIAIMADLTQERMRQVEDAIGDGAIILRSPSMETAVELLQSVPAELIVLEMPRLTDERLAAYVRLRCQAQQALMVCIASDEVIERSRHEDLTPPDLWLRTDCGEDDRRELLGGALETAQLRAETGRLADGVPAVAEVVQSGEGRPDSLAAFNRVMSGLTSGFDLDRLAEAFVDAVIQFSHCACYALLWEAADGCLRIRRHQGVRAEVVEGARLRPHDALPTWYRRNRRVLTASELPRWEDRRGALKVRREMDLFGGQVALPMIIRGRLAGILILGEKVLGESYSTGEIETLFSVTNHVALAAESIELHEELVRSKAYADSIVESMGAGLITLDTDERIGVCNPYASEVLGLDRSEVEGADLRALPSPLGDMLFAALSSEDAEVIGREVSISGGMIDLRVSASTVRDPDGRALGSVLMLDDITAERELAQERSRSERLDVAAKIVGRIAHEVKNPLTAVKTYAELMSGGRGGDRLAHFWSETVLPEIDRLDDMLKNLLRMVEQSPPSLKSAHVEDIVQAAVDSLPVADEIKHQMLHLHFSEDLPSVMVDPVLTRDALSYLLEYLAGEAPHPVEVQVSQNGGDPRTVRVKMTRLTGNIGNFDPDTVFDPLHAMQNLECPLGPVVSQKIIDNQHGWIEASKEAGRVSMSVVLPHHQASGRTHTEVLKGDCEDTRCR